MGFPWEFIDASNWRRRDGYRFRSTLPITVFGLARRA